MASVEETTPVATPVEERADVPAAPRWPRAALAAAIAAALIVAPLAVSAYTLSLLISIMITILPVAGLTMLVGFAGQVSVAQAACAGLGAYLYANLTLRHGWSPLVAMVVAVVVVFLIGLAIARPILRLRGYYLAMATLGIGLIASSVFSSLSGLTGGFSGLANIPTLSLFGFAFDTPERLYYYATAICVVVVLGLRTLSSGDYGRRLRTIRESELAAGAYGINVPALKTQVFAIASGLAALSGVVYAQYVTFISPETFTINQSISYLLGSVIGGLGSLWGSVAGGAYVVLLPHVLQHYDRYATAISGLIMVLIIVLLPGGIVDGVRVIVAQAVKLARRATGGR